MEWNRITSVRLSAYHAGLRLLRASGVDRVPFIARRGLGAILTLHHVEARGHDTFDPNRGLSVTPEFLDAALGWLKAQGYRFVSLAELHTILMGGASVAKGPVVAFTLDDGYRDNRDAALPVFQRHNAPFTVFVTPGFAERRVILWWEVLARVLRRAPEVRFDFGSGIETLLLTDDAAREAAWCRIRLWVTSAPPAEALVRIAMLADAAGFDALGLTAELTMDVDELITFAHRSPLVTLGAHTDTHAKLSALDDASALAEMHISANKLHTWLGKRPRFLAYPYGFRSAASAREFRLAREAGFEMAVTTRPGMLFPEHRDHLTALPRVSLNGEFQDLTELSVLMSGAPFMLRNRLRALDVA